MGTTTTAELTLTDILEKMRQLYRDGKEWDRQCEEFRNESLKASKYSAKCWDEFEILRKKLIHQEVVEKAEQ